MIVCAESDEPKVSMAMIVALSFMFYKILFITIPKVNKSFPYVVKLLKNC